MARAWAVRSPRSRGCRRSPPVWARCMAEGGRAVRLLFPRASSRTLALARAAADDPRSSPRARTSPQPGNLCRNKAESQAARTCAPSEGRRASPLTQTLRVIESNVRPGDESDARIAAGFERIGAPHGQEGRGGLLARQAATRMTSPRGCPDGQVPPQPPRPMRVSAASIHLPRDEGPGVIGVYTYEDVPCTRFTPRGQSYPELSPYDGLILEDKNFARGRRGGHRRRGDRRGRRARPLSHQGRLRGARRPRPGATRRMHRSRRRHPRRVDYHPTTTSATARGTSWPMARTRWATSMPPLPKPTSSVVARARRRPPPQAMMEPFCAFAPSTRSGRISADEFTPGAVPYPPPGRRSTRDLQSQVRIVKPRAAASCQADGIYSPEVFTPRSWRSAPAAKVVYTREEMLAVSNSRHQMVLHVRT